MPGVIQSSQHYKCSQEAVAFESVFELGLSEIIGALKIKKNVHLHLIISVMETLDFKVTMKKRTQIFIFHKEHLLILHQANTGYFITHYKNVKCRIHDYKVSLRKLKFNIYIWNRRPDWKCLYAGVSTKNFTHPEDEE